VAAFATALLAAGRVDEAVEAARRAVSLPAEDARSRSTAALVLARALTASGAVTEARSAAEDAVQAAYATQQVSDRAAADAALASARALDGR
jgi:Flp pilus assembly protein TadD